jgi:uncharacterized protein YndB with AHSA1/START domain
MTTSYGKVAIGAEGRSVRFERHFDASPEEVWAALTDPEQVRVWLLAEATFELEVGGGVTFDWGEQGECSGTVSLCDPPHVLEYSWIEKAGTSIARFELRPAEVGGVLLILDHRELPASAHAGVGAGWHAHLEALAALLASRPFEFWQRFHELEPHYEKVVADLGAPTDVSRSERRAG